MSGLIAVASLALGFYLGSRCLAALYGLIDFAYAMRSVCPRVLAGIALWTVPTLAAVVSLRDGSRVAFLCGLAAAPVVHFSLYRLRHLIIRKPPAP